MSLRLILAVAAWLVHASGAHGEGVDPAFARWREQLGTRRVTLIYAEQYAGNPASLFGHAFLRLSGDDAQPEALDTVVGFLATVPPETSGPEYAYKGIFGGFAAHYQMASYVDGWREYRDLENRSLWEYELRLSPEALERLLFKLWVAQGQAFPYRFLSYNCASGLLDLLETAAPRRPVYELPVDPVRELVKRGMAKPRRRLPSSGEALEARLARMSAASRDAAEALADGEAAAGGASDRDALEAAVELIAFKHHKKGDVADPEDEARRKALLERRAELGGTTAPVVVTEGVPPHAQHAPVRVGVGGGAIEERRYAVLDVRPGVHGWMDPSDGFLRETEMEVLRANVAVDVRSKEATVRQLDFVSLKQRTPMSAIERRPAWGLDVGARRGFGERARLFVEGEAGLVGAVGAVLPYVLAAARVETRPGETNVGPGGKLGVLVDPGRFKVDLRAERFVAMTGRRGAETEVAAEIAVFSAAEELGARTWAVTGAWSRKLVARASGFEIGVVRFL